VSSHGLIFHVSLQFSLISFQLLLPSDISWNPFASLIVDVSVATGAFLAFATSCDRAVLLLETHLDTVASDVRHQYAIDTRQTHRTL
jgi:hypothetical protein